MSNDPKPPFVRFETRAVEDREQSVSQGHFVAKDVIYAVITPAGTKDRIEKVAEEWLHDLEEAVRQERFPQQWLSAFQQAFTYWKENHELPEDGTSVSNWPGASPAQVRMFLDIGLRTVEQVAEANEEALSRMGMGARALKQKAQAWLDAAHDTGKVAAELDKLRQDLTALQTRETAREAELKTLQAENEALKKATDAKK